MITQTDQICRFDIIAPGLIRARKLVAKPVAILSGRITQMAYVNRCVEKKTLKPALRRE